MFCIKRKTEKFSFMIKTLFSVFLFIDGAPCNSYFLTLGLENMKTSNSQLPDKQAKNQNEIKKKKLLTNK